MQKLLAIILTKVFKINVNAQNTSALDQYRQGTISVLERKVAETTVQEAWNLHAERDKLKEELAGWAKLWEECDHLQGDLVAQTEVMQTSVPKASNLRTEHDKFKEELAG